MSRTRKVFISLFILFNFMAMVRVHVPLDYKFFATMYKPVDRYLSFFSIYQDWLMFAPNPNRTNLEVSATVEYEDGSKEVFWFPRSYELNVFGKYMCGEKYRKFTTEGLSKDSSSFMWADTSRYVLKKLGETRFEKIPKTVSLYRHWEDIPLLSDGFRTHGLRPDLSKMKSFKFYTYEVAR